MSLDQIIVCSWFAPLLVFIVLPLVMLCVWEVYRLGKAIVGLFSGQETPLVHQAAT